MTVSNHTALYRFTFPEASLDPDTPLSPLILVDLGDLPNSRISGRIDVDPITGRFSGNGTFRPSFGIGSYTLHFCVDFTGARVREAGVFSNNRAAIARSLLVEEDGVNISPQILPAGGWTRFNKPDSNGQILTRVGVSFISVAQACGNAEKEIPDFDFDNTLKVAEDAWHKKLDVIDIDPTGVSKELQTVFWSGTYRSMISPQGINYRVSFCITN
jgi:putative alpha-1,2-mannosidase